MAYTIGAFALGLALTLVLAALLTPRAWWRRPNLGALAILAFGTWAIGSLLLLMLPMLPMLPMAPRQAMAMAAPVKIEQPPPGASLAAIPTMATAGRTYRVFEHLNLRAAGGTGTRRIAVVPAGALVTATGLRAGDWWEVSASIRGEAITGWVSSLWLRRADEKRPAPPHPTSGA
jgi:fumarate reductase subunit D